jgi:hypothetical protein
MKKIAIYFIVVSTFIIFSGYSFAQQDYQKVQDFKAKQHQLEDAVKSAQSTDDLNNIQAQISQLRNDYLANKELLDKSLYPDDLNSSIDKLNNAVNTRSGDFTQITTLKERVSQIQVQIDSLNARNSELLSQIEQMKESNSNDVARLQKSIQELRGSLVKRDRIIMSMLAGMLPNSNVDNSNLASTEKQKIYSETKKTNVIANIKKAIDDNIKFLSVTNLTPDDFNSMKKQQAEFEKVWHNVGPTIASAYSDRKENTQSVNSIESDFETWNSSMDQAAWTSIKQKFSDNGITLNNFSTGDEFIQAVDSYIDNEIKNANANGADSKNLYHVFTDTVWSGMRLTWIPYLINNKLISNSDNDKVEAKLDSWKNTLYQTNYTWLYIILGVLALVLIVSLAKAFRSKKNKLSQSAPIHNS